NQHPGNRRSRHAYTPFSTVPRCAQAIPAPFSAAAGPVAARIAFVSRRRRIQDRAMNPLDRESAILAVSLDAIVSMDHRGLVTEFNPAAEQMFGYSRAETLGRSLAELIIPPRLREAHYQGLRRYLATGEGRVIGTRIELT